MPDSWNALSPVVALVAGGLLLVLGRRLFWLFVGVVGFVVAFRLTGAYLDAGAAGLAAAAIVGLLGAAAAVLVQRLAVTLAGFAAGAVGLLWLAEQLDWPLGPLTVAAAVVAGIAGAWLVRRLFELGLVVLSALVGAALVVEGLGLESTRGPLFVALAAIGAVVQLAGRRRGDRDER